MYTTGVKLCPMFQLQLAIFLFMKLIVHGSITNLHRKQSRKHLSRQVNSQSHSYIMQTFIFMFLILVNIYISERKQKLKLGYVETNTFIKSHATLLLLGIYFSLCSWFLQVNIIKKNQIVENLTFFFLFLIKKQKHHTCKCKNRNNN